MNIQRKYDWRLSNRFSSLPALKLQSFPTLESAASLLATGFMPPVFDQGATSGCTGHGTTADVMYIRAKQGLPFLDLSRLYPYYNARLAEGDPQVDDGASVGDAIEAVMQYGSCPYSDYPTDPALVTVEPSKAAYADAVLHKGIAATRILGSTEASFEYHFKHCLDVGGFPVVFGFRVYKSFESAAVAQTGMAPMPVANEPFLGGHCVLGIAYDDSAKLVRCRNSWKSTWGLQGDFFLPYAYIFDPNMASDFHAITLES